MPEYFEDDFTPRQPGTDGEEPFDPWGFAPPDAEPTKELPKGSSCL